MREKFTLNQINTVGVRLGQETVSNTDTSNR